MSVTMPGAFRPSPRPRVAKAFGSPHTVSSAALAEALEAKALEIIRFGFQKGDAYEVAEKPFHCDTHALGLWFAHPGEYCGGPVRAPGLGPGGWPGARTHRTQSGGGDRAV